MVQAGTTLGNYRMLRKLGEGPLTEVFLAEEHPSGQELAFKVLKKHLARTLPDGPIVEEEVSPSAQLRHSGIVPLLKTGHGCGMHFMTMAYLPGGNLRNCLRDGLSVRQALAIAAQVARALSFAHSKGVTHQSLKPENILFNGRGMAVVSDFSVSRALGFGAGIINREVISDPRYSSPEEMLGLSKLFGRSDLYSLGLVFYEMLTGALPEHRGRSAQEHAPSLPEPVQELQYILDRLLALRPGARYSGAGALLEDLETELKRLSPKPESSRVVLLSSREGRGGGGRTTPLRKETPASPDADDWEAGPVFDSLDWPSEPPVARPAVISSPEVASRGEGTSRVTQPVGRPAPQPQKRQGRGGGWARILACGALGLCVAAGGWVAWSEFGIGGALRSQSVVGAPAPDPGAQVEDGTAGAAPGLSSQAPSAVPTAAEVEQARILAAASDDQRRRFLGALSLAAGGDAEEAAFVYRGLIRANPLQPAPYNNLAALLAARGDLQGALEVLESGFRAHPEYGVLFENLNTLQIESSLARAFPGDASPEPHLQLIQALGGAVVTSTAQAQAGGVPDSVSDYDTFAVSDMPGVESSGEGAASMLSREELIQVEEVLRDWSGFWSSQDVSGYLGSYGRRFVPPRSMSRAEWERFRRNRIETPSRIDVRLEQVAVTPEASDEVRVLALQSYDSDRYSDRTLKVFQLAREEGRWVILQERSLGRLR